MGGWVGVRRAGKGSSKSSLDGGVREETKMTPEQGEESLHFLSWGKPEGSRVLISAFRYG